MLSREHHFGLALFFFFFFLRGVASLRPGQKGEEILPVFRREAVVKGSLLIRRGCLLGFPGGDAAAADARSRELVPDGGGGGHGSCGQAGDDDGDGAHVVVVSVREAARIRRVFFFLREVSPFDE